MRARGHGKPRASIGVSSRRGGAPPPVKKRGHPMRRHLISTLVAAVVAIVAVAAQQREQPSATEDAVASGGNFPLAAKAGQDSNAKTAAPPAAVNQGPFDMNTWKYGPA